MAEHRYKSRKSNSNFIVSGDTHRAFIIAEGEASCNRAVRAKIEECRSKCYDFATADWMARQLSNLF